MPFGTNGTAQRIVNRFRKLTRGGGFRIGATWRPLKAGLSKDHILWEVLTAQQGEGLASR